MKTIQITYADIRLVKSGLECLKSQYFNMLATCPDKGLYKNEVAAYEKMIMDIDDLLKKIL